jgi:hypothetical protein
MGFLVRLHFFSAHWGPSANWEILLGFNFLAFFIIAEAFSTVCGDTSFTTRRQHSTHRWKELPGAWLAASLLLH